MTESPAANEKRPSSLVRPVQLGLVEAADKAVDPRQRRSRHQRRPHPGLRPMTPQDAHRDLLAPQHRNDG